VYSSLSLVLTLFLLINLGWKGLLPVSLLNVMITALVILLV